MLLIWAAAVTDRHCPQFGVLERHGEFAGGVLMKGVFEQ